MSDGKLTIEMIKAAREKMLEPPKREVFNCCDCGEEKLLAPYMAGVNVGGNLVCRPCFYKEPVK